MKKSLFIVLIAAISCVKETPQVEKYEDDALGTFQEVSFEATLPSHVNDVKSQIDGENHVTWSAGDAVKICMPAYEGWESYKKYYGVTQVFTSQGSGGEGRALFKGTWNTSAQCKSNGFVFYPQSVEFESIYNTTYSQGSTTTYYTLPQVQDAVDNTFASNLNPSYAPITKADLDANNAQVTFRNICSLLRITLPSEDYHLKKITIESTSDNGSGRLSGKAQLSLVSDSPGNEIVGYVSTSPQIILQRPDGDESELTPGASYYAVVWAGNNHKGLRFTFTNKDGKECVKEYASQVNFYRNFCKTVSITSGLDFSEAPYLNCDQEDFTVAARGATNSFFVVANNPVSVSSPSNGWLSVTYDGSQVIVVAAANTEPVERTATITITSAGITKTVTVTQPPVYYKRGAVVDDVRNLNENDSYMIFNTNTNWVETDKCWKLTDRAGNLSATSFNDGKITVDQLFKFKKSSSSVASNWNGYSEVIVGSLYSPYNSYYLTTTFRFEGSGSGINFIFASSWGGATSNDIDIWNYNNTTQTLKWSNGLAWGSNDAQGASARKFYIYKVSVAE